MEKLALVAVGGAGGSLLRYGLSLIIGRSFTSGWPFATLTANIAGSFLMGCLAVWLASRGASAGESWRLLLGVGVLGGFTTFSAFSLEVFSLIEKRAFGTAFSYMGGSLVFGLLALWAGMALARKVLA